MMADNAPFHPDLIEFIKHEFKARWRERSYSKFLSKLTRDTSLNYDLHIIGDDLYEVTLWFEEKGVDFSSFKFSKYSPDEATFDCLYFKSRLLKKIPYFKRRLEKYQPVTLGQFEQALKTKKWVDIAN